MSAATNRFKQANAPLGGSAAASAASVGVSMSTFAWGLLALYLLVLLVLAWPLGRWLATLCDGPLPRWMLRVEAPLYRLAGTSAGPVHALAQLRAGAAGLQCARRAGRLCAAAPAGCGCRSTRRAWRPCTPDSSFNTAISFVTNTNWQGYGGEATMSYLTQMLALTVQNFFRPPPASRWCSR